MACSFAWTGKNSEIRTAIRGFQKAETNGDPAAMWNFYVLYEKIIENWKSELEREGRRPDFSKERREMDGMLVMTTKAANKTVSTAERYSPELDAACEVLDNCIKIAKERELLEGDIEIYRRRLDAKVERYSE